MVRLGGDNDDGGFTRSDEFLERCSTGLAVAGVVEGFIQKLPDVLALFCFGDEILRFLAGHRCLPSEGRLKLVDAEQCHVDDLRQHLEGAWLGVLQYCHQTRHRVWVVVLLHAALLALHLDSHGSSYPSKG